MPRTKDKEKIINLALDYFNFMAENYPVMCTSDEFYFFPRAKKSLLFLHILDCLNKDKIQQDIRSIKILKSSLEKVKDKDLDLEAHIDKTMLCQNMAAFLNSFQVTKIWKIDPTLYLKILLLGLAQILNQLSFLDQNFDEVFLRRISQIPKLINQAKNNLGLIPAGLREVALEMVNASIQYCRNIPMLYKTKTCVSKDINTLMKKAIQSLEEYKCFLIKRPIKKGFIQDKNLLSRILTDSFSYKRSLKEIFQIAQDRYHATLKKLDTIARQTKTNKRWQEILSQNPLTIRKPAQLLKLYSDQILKIKRFLENKDILTIPRTQEILVQSTPSFMKPIRASASYACPITSNRNEKAYFYVTADFAKASGKNKKYIFDNIHKEYMFVTAHETYPGHHLLDAKRRNLSSSIRSQIESVLFYEGWASYAERLIDQFGYIRSPVQKIVGLRRQAWRAVRAMLDAGVRINKLKPEDGTRLLTHLGYNQHTVKLMIRHYLLTPGYQLCYTIGKFEFERLRDTFVSKLGLKKFHDLILESGQIPFDLLEKKLKKKTCRKNS